MFSVSNKNYIWHYRKKTGNTSSCASVMFYDMCHSKKTSGANEKQHFHQNLLIFQVSIKTLGVPLTWLARGQQEVGATAHVQRQDFTFSIPIRRWPSWSKWEWYERLSVRPVTFITRAKSANRLISANHIWKSLIFKRFN